LPKITREKECDKFNELDTKPTIMMGFLPILSDAMPTITFVIVKTMASAVKNRASSISDILSAMANAGINEHNAAYEKVSENPKQAIFIKARSA
jgi:hypothetical protein